eukprot:gene12652-biopygen932
MGRWIDGGSGRVIRTLSCLARRDVEDTVHAIQLSPNWIIQPVALKRPRRGPPCRGVGQRAQRRARPGGRDPRARGGVDAAVRRRPQPRHRDRRRGGADREFGSLIAEKARRELLACQGSPKAHQGSPTLTEAHRGPPVSPGR